VKLGLTWANNDLYVHLFGGFAAALAELKALGLQSLEFAPAALLEPEQKQALHTIQDAGLTLTLHAPTTGRFDVAAFVDEPSGQVRQDWDSFLDQANELSARQGGDLVLATHGASFQAVSPSTRELSRQATTVFLERLVARSEQMGYGLRFGFENRPRISGYTITGDSHAETLDIVRDVEARRPGAGRHLGIAWDMGHSAVNAHSKNDSLHPPEEFVQRVVHVHLHDTMRGDDHYPLIYDGYPYPALLRRLAAVGFAGAINLELSADRLGADGDTARRALETSLQRANRELHKT
jgi:sugar phosphate isomerase/epimerase